MNAVNCELHDTELGSQIGFVKGMEPGTEAFRKLVKRQDQGKPKTTVTFSDAKIEFGNTKPNDVYVFARSACQATTCLNEATVTVRTVEGIDPVERVLTLKPSGQFSGEIDRDEFNSAIAIAAGNGYTTETRDYISRIIGNSAVAQGFTEGKRDIYTQSKKINVNRFVDSKNGALLGFMDVEVVANEEGSGACEVINKILSAIAGAISGVGGGIFAGAEVLCTL